MRGMDALVSSFGKHQAGCITYISLDRKFLSYSINECVFLYDVVYVLIYGVLHLLCNSCIYCGLNYRIQGHLFTYHCIKMQLPISLHNNTIAHCYMLRSIKASPSVNEVDQSRTVFCSCALLCYFAFL